MLMSANQSARVLAAQGVPRTQAQLLLAAGLAGAGTRTAGAVLYDERAVRRLSERPVADTEAVAAACPHGLLVARLARSTTLDVKVGWPTLADQVRVQPAMPPLSRALVAARVAAYGGLPWVATLWSGARPNRGSRG